MNLVQSGYIRILTPIKELNNKIDSRFRDILIVAISALLVLAICFADIRRGLFADHMILLNRLVLRFYSIGDLGRAMLGTVGILLIAFLGAEETEIKPRWNWYVWWLWMLGSVLILLAGVFHDIGTGYFLTQLCIAFIMPLLYFVWSTPEKLTRLYSLICCGTIIAAALFYAFIIALFPHEEGTIYSAMIRNENIMSWIGVTAAIAALYLITTASRFIFWIPAVILGASVGLIYLSVCRGSYLAMAGVFLAFIILYFKNRKSLIRLIISVLIAAIAFTGFYFAIGRGDDFNDLFGMKQEIVVSDPSEQMEETEEKEDIGDRLSVDESGGINKYSSGRIDIWKKYMNYLDFSGNDVKYSTPMRVVNPNHTGTRFFRHGHNVLIEMSFRCGIPVGVFYLLLELLAVIYAAVCVFKRRGSQADGEFFSVMAIAAFFVLANVDYMLPPFNRSVALQFFLACAPLFTFIGRTETASESGKISDKLAGIGGVKGCFRLGTAVLLCICLILGIQNQSNVGMMKNALKESVSLKVDRVQDKYLALGGIIETNTLTDSPDLLWINIGTGNTTSFTSSEIKNIGVLHFSNEKSKTTCVTLNKDTYVPKVSKKGFCKLKNTYKNGAKGMMASIRTATDLNPFAYVVINDKTIIDAVNAVDLIQVEVKFEDLAELNANQEELAKQYHIRNVIKVEKTGVQPLNGLQAAAYAEIDRNDVKKRSVSDAHFRVVIRGVLQQLKKCSMRDVDRVRRILQKGENDFSKDDLIMFGARIKAFKTTVGVTWPKKVKYIKYKGVRYAFPKKGTMLSNAEYLHIKRFKDEGYVPSKKLKLYNKAVEKVLKDIKRIKREKEEAAYRAADESVLQEYPGEIVTPDYTAPEESSSSRSDSGRDSSSDQSGNSISEDDDNTDSSGDNSSGDGDSGGDSGSDSGGDSGGSSDEGGGGEGGSDESNPED